VATAIFWLLGGHRYFNPKKNAEMVMNRMSIDGVKKLTENMKHLYKIGTMETIAEENEEVITKEGYVLSESVTAMIASTDENELEDFSARVKEGENLLKDILNQSRHGLDYYNWDSVNNSAIGGFIHESNFRRLKKVFG
jgi:hypothetical protein